MAKLLLDVALVDLCGTGQASAERMSGKELHAFFVCEFREGRSVEADPGLQDQTLDQPHHMLVREPVRADT